MKTSKQCPKCQSKEIYTNAQTRKAGDRARIPVDTWRGLMIDIYCCLHCGFIEEYISENDLKNDKLMWRTKKNFKAVE